LGAIYQTKADTGAARRSFERALQLDHDDREALTELVTLEVRTNHTARAMALVDAQLAKTPSDPRVLELAARARATTGDLRRAEELLKRLIAADSSNLSAYGMLGQLYISEKRLEDARVEYERALVGNPDSVALQTVVAMILEAENKSDEARRRYERILEKEPNAVVAANNLAWLYIERGENVDLALQLAQRAKQTLPADPRVNDTLGWIYYKRNLIDQAIPLLQDGVRGDANNPLHQHHLGMAYFQAGDWPKAREALERALKPGSWFPGIDDARKALAVTGS
jgi:Tfp pilus assembly protein PilF